MRIDTWADGWGRWYARVPLTNDAKSDKRLAKAAILVEINNRGPAVPVAAGVIKVEVSATTYDESTDAGGTVTYREAGIP